MKTQHTKICGIHPEQCLEGNLELYINYVVFSNIELNVYIKKKEGLKRAKKPQKPTK